MFDGLFANVVGVMCYFPMQNVYFPTQTIFVLCKSLYINGEFF